VVLTAGFDCRGAASLQAEPVSLPEWSLVVAVRALIRSETDHLASGGAEGLAVLASARPVFACVLGTLLLNQTVNSVLAPSLLYIASC